MDTYVSNGVYTDIDYEFKKGTMIAVSSTYNIGFYYQVVDDEIHTDYYFGMYSNNNMKKLNGRLVFNVLIDQKFYIKTFNFNFSYPFYGTLEYLNISAEFNNSNNSFTNMFQITNGN